MTPSYKLTAETIRKEAFDRDKVCYEQNFQQFRSMNQLMWQVPLLAITITGGLWYVALTVNSAADFRHPIFLMSATLDLALIVVLKRIRYVMGAYLTKIKEFNPEAFVEAPGTDFLNRSHTVIWAFTIALLIASVGSVFGFFNIALLKG